MAALGGAVAFIGLNVAISVQAWQAPSRDAPYAVPDRIFASPQPIAFWRRDMVWRQHGTMTFGEYDPLRRLSGLTSFGRSVPDHMEEPLVRRAAQATPEVRKFLAWSQMPVAVIEPQGCAANVTFGDARYSGPTLSRNFNVSVTVPTNAPDCPPPG